MGLFDFLKMKEPDKLPLHIEQYPLTLDQCFEVKECVKCYNRKLLDSFPLANKRTGRRGSWCRQCATEAKRGYRAKEKLLKLTQVPDHVVLEQMGDKQNIADVFFQAQPEVSIQQQLTDLLDDLDILTTRVAKLQAQLNKNE